MATMMKIQDLNLTYSSTRGVSFEPSTMKAALESQSHVVPVFKTREEKLKWMREKVAQAKDY
ncbi:hypothetical protein [Vibrio sp. SBT000027]|jgi:hypothetical protein|uniref:hypothetical protein n=1 Tax=Vibrio sp. SBT000027 TaxID=1803384 RepID=UPI000EF4FB6B|nr:hypothetical protein [Vibrio sp. SBT000027]RLQ16639.1 hypothetical protein AYK60_16050 [Vibrio sp. SBT000027]